MSDDSPTPSHGDPGVHPEKPEKRELGCLLGGVSLLVFITVNDLAVVDALRLRHQGPAWRGAVLGLTPIACVVAWLLISYFPPGKHRLLAPLRFWQRASTPVRHLVLWGALVGGVLLLRCLLVP